MEITTPIVYSTDTNIEDIKVDTEILNPLSVTSNKLSETGSHEDWFGNEVAIPRDTDRILEQFVMMMLRIGVHLKREGSKYSGCHMFTSGIPADSIQRNSFHSTVPVENSDTPPLVASSSKYPASYVRDYPKIFMKKASEVNTSMPKSAVIRQSHSTMNNNIEKKFKSQKRSVTVGSKGIKSVTIEKEISKKIIHVAKSSSMDSVDRLKANEKKLENTGKYGSIGNAKGSNKYNKTLKQASCSCLDNSESSDSINSIIQRIKMRLSESGKGFHEDKKSE